MHSDRLKILAQKNGKELLPLQKVASRYPFQLSKFLYDRLQDGSYPLDAAKQYLPDVRELSDHEYFVSDPCNESKYMATTRVVQKYGNRAALIVTQKCFVYCRFCFRRDFVGNVEQEVSDQDVDEGISYIENNKMNRDILLSGGDPLVLPNRRLLPLLERLSEIDHLKVIRIHTRALSARPERFDKDLLEAFRRSGKIWLYSHMNHPSDLDHPTVITTARKIQAVGVPTLNQAVLLAGVNDGPGTLLQLFNLCYENKIIPYHLYALDRVKGAAHFEIGVDRILELIEELQDLPGPAQPVFVIVDQENLKNRLVFSAMLDLKKVREVLTTKTVGATQCIAN